MAATVSSPEVPTPSRAKTRVLVALRHGARATSRGSRFFWKHAARRTAQLTHIMHVTLRRGIRTAGRAAVLTMRRVGKVRPALSYTANLVHYHHADELRQCPACRSQRLSLLAPLPLNARPRGRRFGFVTGCQGCGLVFSNPLPTAEQLQAFYSPGGEWDAARHGEPPRAKACAATYVVELFAPARPSIDPQRPAPGASVFELGCGDGELLDALQGFGWATSGLDPADKRAFARHREFTEVPREAMFDVVIAHHVLEHIATPLTVLQALNGALKPGGLLLVSVPRLDTLHRHRDFRYCINPRTHIVSYTRDCLATLFSLAGFDAVDASPPPDAPGDDWFVLRRLRMMGRKTATPAAPPAYPLRAARRALSAFHAHQPAADGWVEHLPVRTRAALAELHRGRRVS